MWITSRFGAGDYQAMSWHRELATVVILSSKMMVGLEEYPFGVPADSGCEDQTRRDGECYDLSAHRLSAFFWTLTRTAAAPPFALVAHAWPGA
jgi:hypothetical protein